MWFKAGWTVARPNGWAHGARYCQHMLLDIIELSQWCWVVKRGGMSTRRAPPCKLHATLCCHKSCSSAERRSALNLCAV